MSQPNAPVSGSPAAQTTGARLVVDALLTHGVERVFCVPGESFLAVLDSLHDETSSIQTSREATSGSASPSERIRSMMPSIA